ADPPQRGGEEPPHHRVVVGRVQQDRGLLLEERARVRAQGVGRGRGSRRWHRRAFSWGGYLPGPGTPGEARPPPPVNRGVGRGPAASDAGPWSPSVWCPLPPTKGVSTGREWRCVSSAFILARVGVMPSSCTVRPCGLDNGRGSCWIPGSWMCRWRTIQLLSPFPP